MEQRPPFQACFVPAGVIMRSDSDFSGIPEESISALFDAHSIGTRKDRKQVRAVSGAPIADARGHGRRAASSPQTVCPSLKRRLTLDVTARVTRIGRAEPQNKEGESWTIIAGLSSIDTSKLRNAVAV